MEATDDSILYEDSFETMKVAELKAQLKARNLPTSGLRSELIARLQEAAASSKDSIDDEEDEEEEEEEDDDDDLEGDTTSEMPSQVSLFVDSHLDEELHDEILNDPDSPTKQKHDSFGSLSSSSISITKPSPSEIKVTKTPLKPLKRTTTIVPSNGTDSSAKKICLVPPISPTPPETVPKKSTHVPVTIDASDSTPAKSVSLVKTMTPQEKLELRAKRFNLQSSTNATTQLNVTGKRSFSATRRSNFTPIEFDSVVPDMEKLKKRAERFGVVSTILKKIEEKDKVKQRLQRFSSSNEVSLSKDEEEKRKTRLERFGAT